jgi:MoxR-like ATPase
LFEYLLGRFTEPSEIFGPVDLTKLKDGVVVTATGGMLPEADVAFLDEVFLGSTAILNTLLGILNERTFRRGHTQMRCPLRVCIGASNALPDDPTLAAFADRFLLRTFVEPVPDPLLEDLLAGGRAVDVGEQRASSSLAALDVLSAAAKNADIEGVRQPIADAVRALRQAGVELTDRRIVKLLRVVSAAGVLAGRAAPTRADLWPIVYCVPVRDAQDAAREALQHVLAQSDNAALANAALDASEGPRARSRLLAERGAQLLAESASGVEQQVSWRRRAEGILREIDAAFDPKALPDDLGNVRNQLATRVQSRASA